MKRCRVILKLATNDAAITNDCLTRHEQDAARLATREDHIRAHLDLYCQGHQSCLLTRPVVDNMSDYGTCIIRLGHILSHSGDTSNMLAACGRHLDSTFEYIECLELPAEHVDWRRKSEWIMRSSLASRDITEEDIQRILDHDNSDWEEKIYLHYHLVIGCPCGCIDAADSLRMAKENTRLSLGMDMDVGLQYRWKHMDRALSYVVRGRGEHDILLFALCLMWIPRDLIDAEALVAAAENVDDLGYQVKKRAKASTVIRCFKNDSDRKVLIGGFVCCGPLQMNLNRVMKADGLVCKYVVAMECNPSSPETAALKRSAAKINSQFLNGNYGRHVQQDFSAMLLNSRHDSWVMFPYDDDMLLKAQVGMVNPLCGGVRRLVHYFLDEPRFQIVNILGDSGSDPFNADRVLEVIGPLRANADACDECLDPSFAAEMVKLLETSPREGYGVLEDALPITRVGSVMVERAHLFGQDLKPVKSRGLARDAAALETNTYVRSAIRNGELVAAAVEEEFCRARGVDRGTYLKILRGLRVDRSSTLTDRKFQRIVNVTQPKKSVRRDDAYRQFRRRHWGVHAQVVVRLHLRMKSLGWPSCGKLRTMLIECLSRVWLKLPTRQLQNSVRTLRCQR